MSKQVGSYFGRRQLRSNVGDNDPLSESAVWVQVQDPNAGHKGRTGTVSQHLITKELTKLKAVS